jgi:uncharacterized protein YbaR (Trm112 family)/ubiquinone/menaquinone biosynthesis C-methylase UbiE
MRNPRTPGRAAEGHSTHDGNDGLDGAPEETDVRAIATLLLRCPVTRGELHLLVEKGEPAPLPVGVPLDAYDGWELATLLANSNLLGLLARSGGSLAERIMGYEVLEGALYTADRLHVYPIVGGIPRLLPPDVAQHPAAIEHYRVRLGGSRAPAVEGAMDRQWKQILDHNIESYTLQWSEFDYSETTWGFTIEERFEMIQDELGIRGQLGELTGKRHVDAACGNGTLALRTAEIGLEVVAFDQSHSIERAYAFAREKGLPQRGIVHFVQGNLVAPPVRPGAFHTLYSGGAIHMTPDFEHTLRELAALLKPSGSRMYVWTGRRRRIVGALYDAIRRFLSLFSVPMRRGVARAGVVPYMGIQWMLRQLYGVKAFPKVSFNENLVRFLDAASHRFGQIPSAEEFEAMVAKLGFDSQETKRPGHRGYGILAIHR